MANFFKITRDQDMAHVSAIIIVNLVGSLSHNLGAMTKQTTEKTGRKRIDNIEHFNIDPTSLLDDNARQHKKPKVLSLGTIAKRDAIWRRLFWNHPCVILFCKTFDRLSTCDPNRACLARKQW